MECQNPVLRKSLQLMYKNRHFCQHRYFKTIKSRVPRLLNGYCLEKYKIRKNIFHHHKIH